MIEYFPTFVINLDDEFLRRESISQQLDKINAQYNIFSAVNGNAMTNDELNDVYSESGAILRQSRPLTPSEIGCALSHIRVYEKIIENKIDAALIIEDDAILEDDFPRVLREIGKIIKPAEREVFLLSKCEHLGEIKLILPCGYKVCEMKVGYYTSSYIITYAGAKALVNTLFPIHDVADCWNRLQGIGAIEIYGIDPAVASQNKDEFQSSISPEVAAYFNNGMGRALVYKLRRIISIGWTFVESLFLKAKR